MINIGLTFYGGVSLAVYEAGVAETFIRFLQFCKESGGQGKPGAGIPEVDISVISGSSAGGLAAVLMSATLVNSSDPTRHIQEIRRIWFDVADMDTLQYKGGQDVSSFLNNDVLESEVRKFLSLQDGTQGLCDDIKILVTATNMQGYFDAVAVEEDFTDKDNYAKQVFPTIRHTEVFEFDRADIKDANEDAEKQKRIAKAARITSSFPAAFPPQLAQSPSFPEETVESYVDAKGKPAEKPLHFWYFDGGVLDNKPLGHAIDHMQSSKRDGKWWYFFIEPIQEVTDPAHKEWGVDPGNPPDPWATVMAIVDVKMAETIYYDLRRIQRLNHQIMQINSLVGDIWHILGDNRANVPSGLLDNLLMVLENHVKTARLYDFMPDYLKCVTMIKYTFTERVRTENPLANMKTSDKHLLFFKEVTESLAGMHGKVMDGTCPMALRRIIRECRLQIESRKMDLGLPEKEKGLLAGKIRLLEDEESYKDHFRQYEDDVQKVKSAQLVFRQISFWVEDDNKNNNGKLSGETWKAFKEAWDKLSAALESLNKSYGRIISMIRETIADDTLMEKIVLFIRLNESFCAAAGVQTGELINVVKIYHNQDYGQLGGAKLANFAGFLERRWRKNDYAMGKRDAREMLEGKMKAEGFSEEFWNSFDDWLKAQELKIDYKFRLGDRDIITEGSELALNNLAAGKLVGNIDGIMKTSQKMINKYREKRFFNILKRFKINWLIILSRRLLWVVKQATAQPSCQDGTRDISTMAQFKSGGRRYVGFLLIGIIIGLVLSFFLPDAIRNAADWVLQQIRELFAK